jgi:hypothetical protein
MFRKQRLLHIFYKLYKQYFSKATNKDFINIDYFKSISDHVIKSKNYNFEKINPGQVVFTESHVLSTLNENTFSNILLFVDNSNSDIIFSDLNKSLMSNNYNKIYVHNYEPFLNKQLGIDLLPTGIHNKTDLPYGKMSHFKNKNFSKLKQTNIYCSFNVTTNENRINILNSVKDNNLVHFHNYLNHKKYLNNLSEYKYNLCPEGTLYDTHRFWESLVLEVIPIVKKSYTTSYYKKLGIPLLQVNYWEEIDYIDKKTLDAVYERFHNDLKSKKFVKTDYWRNVIKIDQE